MEQLSTIVVVAATGGVGDLSTGTHACCVFADAQHKRAVVSAFLAAGLERGERVAYYWHDDERSAYAAVPPGYDVDTLLASKQLIVGSADEAYFPNGEFDGEARAADFAEYAACTVDEGFTGLRVFADNGWMPAALPDPLAWLDYETRVALLIPQQSLTGLCGFDAAEVQVLTDEAIDAVHATNLAGPRRPSAWHVHGDGDGVLCLEGEIDALSADDMRRTLTLALANDPSQVVSLGELFFVDAAAADALYSTLRTAQAPVVAVPEPVAKVWALLGRDPATLKAAG